ncbi:M28 family peptidase [Parashewanella curva]|uniref:M28 family peptidase n=1 Tax=Parashewanella curva TaxID=2338552 RepID=A0A3L8PYH7_9GAMM|nr:M28 family metallopeptidase [Parashewanella curva]RLV59518.1 M28 family peptidase [Parashewanella curva]
MNKASLYLSAAAISCIAFNVSAETYQFHEKQYRQDVQTLSSTKFAGRAPLSPQEKLTTDYLVNAYKNIGLLPGYKGKYLQPVPMAKITTDQNMSLNIGDQSFTNMTQFTARTERLSDQIDLSNSDVVFCGYGINAPEYHWNDYQGVDVKGKTVIVLVNDPGFATQDPNLFTGNAMTYYGRWTYKFEEAARQGAKAVFVVHETAPAGYGWDVVQNSVGGTQLSLVDADNNNDTVAVMGWLQHDTAQKIFTEAGYDFDKLKQTAISRQFKPIDLKLQANLTLNNHVEQSTSYNVIAKLPASTQTNESILVHAHWDHLGQKVDSNGTVHTFHGAVDNASGDAGVMDLARNLKAQADKAPFKRNIIFADFTGEEAGLIGAKQFAQNPSVSTKDLVAMVNIDGMNTNKAQDYVLDYGKGLSTLDNYLADAAQAQGRTVKPDPNPQTGLYFRSDHFALAQVGVPSLLFMGLGDPDYVKYRYHKEADQYEVSWDLGAAQQDLALMSSIIAKLANNNDWPKWTKNSAFKKRRAEDGR